MLTLSSLVSVSDIILLKLSEFHVNCVNDYCVVCCKVDEVRGRYDAKLQHVFLTFFDVFCKNVKIVLENESFVEIKPVRYQLLNTWKIDNSFLPS